MSKKSSTKKKTKLIILLVTVCVLLLGGVSGYLVISHQKKAVVNDYTENLGPAGSTGENGSGENGADGTDDATAILSSNVKIFADEDAAAVNNAISGIQITSNGLYVDIAAGTPLENLGVGDIFYLDGSERTPLGEPYIGKITSISGLGNTKTYLIEAPMVDEVFDVLDFDYEQIMTTDNISEIKTAEGVTVTKTDNLASQFSSLSNSSFSAVPLVHRANLAANTQKLNEFTGSLDGLLFEFEIDLLELFNLKKDDIFDDKYNIAEGSQVTVYTTNTGICYHRDGCRYLSRSKRETTLSEVRKKYRPCTVCKPPVSDDIIDLSLDFEGKVGIESIAFNLKYDWDILNGNGIEELSISTHGNFLGEAKLNANAEIELGGQKTEIKLPLDCVKLQGLKEKLFPIAFVGYNGSVVSSVMAGNQGIRPLTKAVPLTVAAVIYIDIDGKISVGASAFFRYEQPFNYDLDVVKDGKWVWNSDFNLDDPKIDVGIDVELSGDVDICLGGSISVYVFNLNIVDLAIVKSGIEAEGNVKLTWSKATQETTDNAVSLTYSYHARVYLKLLEFNVKIKAKLSLGAFSTSKELAFSKTLKDITLAEWGEKNPTRYKEGSMSYSAMTAKDENAIYYKDTDGSLIKEVGGYRTVLYTEDFFMFCGIDETYLYVLKPNENGVYDIYRISKETGLSKKIVEDVSACLTTDESKIYYVSKFDSTTISSIDRETLEESQYATFQNDVKFMAAQGDGFYVVTGDTGFLAQLFGSASSYYLLDKSGQIVGDYGTNPKVSNYYLSDNGDYYAAVKMVGSGYLRNTAAETYWMSKNTGITILTDNISGWNQSTAGIFTTLRNRNAESDAPYKIVLYRAEDGAVVDVAEVYSDQAFFTLCQSSSGDWYFFDQTDTELILYVLSADFSQKKAVQTFMLSEIPYNLKDCSMKIMDNRAYFYTMPNSTKSIVLYRFDIE